MKIDAVPGLNDPYRITPDRIGTYPVLRGAVRLGANAVMRSTTKVVTPPSSSLDHEAKAPSRRRRGRRGAPPDGAAPAAGATTASGRRQAGVPPDSGFCGGCHHTADAGTTGQVGPDLERSGAGGKDAAFIKDFLTDPSADNRTGLKTDSWPKSSAVA